jgi:hypothetical protein
MMRIASIHELPRETVRKTPSGSELKPQKSTKQVEEGLFRYSEDLKWRLQRLL